MGGIGFFMESFIIKSIQGDSTGRPEELALPA